MSLSPRDYQTECVNSILNHSKKGVFRQLVCLPTGSGKTIIMSALAKELNTRTLIIAHREELITQALEKFKLFWPCVDIGICMAGRSEIDKQVVVGSVQSCSRPRRLKQLKQQGFDLMMIDEAHHAPASSYQTIIDALGFNKGSKLLVGVTATPQRSDNVGLGNTFEEVTFNRSIATMINAGYLSPVIGRKVLTNFVLRGIRSFNGDFSASDLSEAVNTPERNAFIVEKFIEHAKDRKAVAFCADVEHCKDLADSFNREGVKSEAVWGEMNKDDRKRVLNDLKKGHIQVVTSCGILVEGFDEPSIQAVIMARPTKSAGLYIQCVGRGLRTWPSKPNCLVLDFTDKSHNLDNIVSLSCTIPEVSHLIEEDEEGFSEELDTRPKLNIFEESDREFDILGGSRFIWVPIGDNELSLLDDNKQEIVITPKENGYVASVYFTNGSKKEVVNSPLPLEYCSGVCEDYARKNLKIEFADTSAPWMREVSPPTQGQRELLKKNKAFREGMSKAEASFKIRELIALKNKQRRSLPSEPVTTKQKQFLSSCGIDANSMSKLEAIKRISTIKESWVKYG